MPNQNEFRTWLHLRYDIGSSVEDAALKQFNEYWAAHGHDLACRICVQPSINTYRSVFAEMLMDMYIMGAHEFGTAATLSPKKPSGSIWSKLRKFVSRCCRAIGAILPHIFLVLFPIFL